MEKLLEGIVNFRKGDYEEHKDLFFKLREEQKPHTLFIGCSDSRLVPNLITQTLPGELFVIRNIANIVPPYRKSQEYLSTTSAIEYAINVLQVENIIVCAHSNCGGCNALFLPDEALKHTQHTKKWLQLMGTVKKRVLKELPVQNDTKRQWLTEQINVVEQIKHLLTYPNIRENYQKGKLTIRGWYYLIETGEVFEYNKDNGAFELAN